MTEERKGRGRREMGRVMREMGRVRREMGRVVRENEGEERDRASGPYTAITGTSRGRLEET